MTQFREVSKKQLKSSRIRHLMKTVSWRFVGSIDTLIIALLFTKDSEASEHKAIVIVLADTVVKMALYYFHERLWYRIPYGIKNHKPQNKRHVAKAISWRILGTIATFLLAALITGDWKIGMNIAGVEVITKIILYYFHERIWLKINIKLNHESR